MRSYERYKRWEMQATRCQWITLWITLAILLVPLVVMMALWGLDGFIGWMALTQGLAVLLGSAGAVGGRRKRHKRLRFKAVGFRHWRYY